MAQNVSCGATIPVFGPALKTATLSKKIEVYNPLSKSSYYAKPVEAQRLVRLGHADWAGHGVQSVIMRPDDSKRGIYEKRQSGPGGPMVLQLT